MVPAATHQGAKVVVDKSGPPACGVYERHTENPDFQSIRFGEGEVL